MCIMVYETKVNFTHNFRINNWILIQKKKSPCIVYICEVDVSGICLENIFKGGDQKTLPCNYYNTLYYLSVLLSSRKQTFIVIQNKKIVLGTKTNAPAAIAAPRGRCKAGLPQVKSQKGTLRLIIGIIIIYILYYINVQTNRVYNINNFERLLESGKSSPPLYYRYLVIL